LEKEAVLEKTAAACAVTALSGLIALSLAGWWRGGLALAGGLALGPLNIPLTRHALGSGTDFRVTSVFRLGLLTALGLLLAAVVGWALGWMQAPLVIGGLALAQLLMAGAGVMEVLRA
jgi:hypothetical protein